MFKFVAVVVVVDELRERLLEESVFFLRWKRDLKPLISVLVQSEREIYLRMRNIGCFGLNWERVNGNRDLGKKKLKGNRVNERDF